ncbi:MAG TPA: sel1 repeat family protein [Nitrospinota bacterium]|nr:sel1 repeat family protein [Nitrospinota bacterium]
MSADYQKGEAAYEKCDYEAALREFKPLAEQGHADAQYKLGLMYHFGRGVLKDNVYAHMWFSIAVPSGNKDAYEFRDIVAKRMTSAEISTAKELARECVKKNFNGF